MANKWYEQTGDQGDIVLSTRIRLARNVENLPFPNRLNSEKREELCNQIKDHILVIPSPLTRSLGYFSPETLSQGAKRAMAERHLLPREFAENKKERPILLSEDESVCLLLCHQDHIRLQVLKAGLDLQGAYQIASGLDDMLNEGFAYAFDKQWGYITQSPADLGTGMKASVLLHLPALEATGEIHTLATAVGKIGLSLQGTFGQGSTVSGSLYQLSNQISMGLTEDAALENLKSITLQIVHREREARKELPPLQTEDTAFRALGLLQNARILPLSEFTQSLSHLRLGIAMGMIERVTIEQVNALNATMHPATLLLENPEADSTEKRDVFRANKIREYLK